MSDRIYLDHNATTPVDHAVIAAMEPYLREFFGNPSSIEHEDGHAAARAVSNARAQVADAIGARENEIIFTGSCTEADNLAIFGVARSNPDKKHLVTTAIEHPAVREPARALEREGWRVSYMPVDEDGRVSVSAIAECLSDETALVSVMAANNEVGSLQPIREIGALCAERGVLFHTDLAQIIAYGDIVSPHASPAAARKCPQEAGSRWPASAPSGERPDHRHSCRRCPVLPCYA